MIARVGSFDLRLTGGLYQSDSRLALLFALTAAGLVGLPPLSGFWAKLLVVRAGVAQEQYVWVAAALLTGALTLLSMTKIWLEAFWRPRDTAQEPRARQQPVAFWLASASLAALALAIGLVPAPLLEVVADAAADLHVAGPESIP
jgi:multicomponent Na+:H+ antiporter subunit D